MPAGLDRDALVQERANIAAQVVLRFGVGNSDARAAFLQEQRRGDSGLPQPDHQDPLVLHLEWFSHGSNGSSLAVWYRFVTLMWFLAQFQGGQREQGKYERRDPEPDDDLRFRPAHQF